MATASPNVDGIALRSCQLTIGDLDRGVTSVEGLGIRDNPNPVQVARIAHQVAQSAFCQSGQIMQVVSYLSLAPASKDQQIDTALSRNPCRCGTGERRRAAAQDATTRLYQRKFLFIRSEL
jgi:isoquinoline 1-oxidoreductase alpha subunit